MAQDFSGASQEKLQETLLEAAALGDLSVLNKIAKRLDKGDGIKKTIEITKDSDGLGAFHVAASHGITDICRYLIEHLDFDPDFRSDQGHDESIEFLLSKGIPVDPESYRGTLLHVAVAYCQEKTVKILLEHNAELNKVSNELFTPLHISISFGGSLNCTKLLIKAGADVNLYCHLATAIVFNSAETVKCLLEAGADPNIPSDYGMLPIEIAAECGEKRFVEMLLPLTSQLPTVCQTGLLKELLIMSSLQLLRKRRKERFADLKVKGQQAFRRSEYLAAINFYTAAMEMAPTDAAIFANRSLCWLRMLEGDLALEDAMMAQSFRPNWPKAYYRVGAAFMLLKKYEEASQVLLDGFKLDPANMEMEKALLEALDCMKKI